jgi:hypothetical protein
MRALWRFRYAAASLLVVVLPLQPLFRLKNVFYIDWINHVWAMAYYGEFFRAHGAFPVVIHTNQVAGLVQPLFYGRALYAIGGLFAGVLGADVAVRIVVFALMLAQFYAAFRLIQVYSANRRLSWAVGVLLTWSIYPLTNLYNRGALTEFAAVCLLQIAVCIFLAAIKSGDTNAQVRGTISAGLFYALASMPWPH